MIEAVGDKLDAVKIYKKGKNTQNIFQREIGPQDWKSKSGYNIKVWSQDEKNAQDSEVLQKLNAAVTFIPGNLKLLEVYQRKLLEFSDLKPEEINDIMEFEQQKIEMMTNPMASQTMQPQMQPQQPQQQLQPGGKV
jgi:hypothetical protein